MQAWILDRKFQAVCVLDAFESFIWTERYKEPGEFEIYIPTEKTPLEYMVKNYYVWQKNSDRLMILEDLNIETSSESGSYITATGRSLESILSRRIIAFKTVMSGNMQDGLEKIFNDNIISPRDSNRKIPELKFVRSEDERITDLTYEATLLGEDILELVQTICELYDLGFKITYHEDDETPFHFELYYGVDRSYSQEERPWVVFSPKYDNLLGSNYFESERDLKTAGIVIGSDSDSMGQEIVDVDQFPDLTGLDRREVCIDGSDIDRPETEVNEESIRERLERRGWTEEEIEQAIEAEQIQMDSIDRGTFRDQLLQKGKEEISKTCVTEAFEGEIDAVRQYIYDKDFFLGDIVQIQDQYGKEGCSRVTEVVRTHDSSGESVVPTFTTYANMDS